MPTLEFVALPNALEEIVCRNIQCNLHYALFPFRQVHLLLSMVRAQPALLQQLGDGAVMQLQKELEKMEKLKELNNVTEEEKMESDKAAWIKWISLYR